MHLQQSHSPASTQSSSCLTLDRSCAYAACESVLPSATHIRMMAGSRLLPPLVDFAKEQLEHGLGHVLLLRDHLL